MDLRQRFADFLAWLRVAVSIIRQFAGPLLSVLAYLSWAKLWGFIRIASEIDFVIRTVLGLPEVADFLANDFGIFFLVLTFIWAAAILYRKNRLRPALLCGAVGFIFFGYFGFAFGQLMPKLELFTALDSPIMSHGGTQREFNFILDMTRYKRFHDSYRVGVMCTADDPSTPIENRHFTRSELYTITDEVRIDFPPTLRLSAYLCREELRYSCTTVLVPNNDEEEKVFFRGVGGRYNGLDCERTIEDYQRTLE